MIPYFIGAVAWIVIGYYATKTAIRQVKNDSKSV